MRERFWERFRRAASIALYMALAAALVVNLAGAVLDIHTINASGALRRIDKYEVRSELLQEAMDYVGACRADTAVQVWAQGVQMRSAAMQYSAMSAELKALYAQQLEEQFPNWVTGVSSPWIDRFEIKSLSATADSAKYRVRFDTATSTGPAGQYDATLTLACQGEFWRIVKLETDEELYPYTGFTP